MSTFQYPGFDLGLRHLEDEHYPVGFPEAMGGESKILQMREVAMMMLMDQITDKSNWHEKVFDEAIVQKWRQEAADQPEASLFARIMEGKESKRIPQPSKIVTAQAFEYARLIEKCIEELRNKAKYFRETGITPTLDSSRYCVVKSDKLFSEDLRAELVNAFDILRADQAADVDWHPKSNDMVQDLVHPSMYPFIYGKTPFINEEKVGLQNAIKLIGQGAAISEPMQIQSDGKYGKAPGSPVDRQYWSEKFQWLPANVSFQDDDIVKLTSYVNNLHPLKSQGIYKTIEKAIEAAIPLWDQCLQEYDEYDRVEVTGRSKSRFEGIVKADDDDASLWSDFDVEHYLCADIPVSKVDEQAIAKGYFGRSLHFFEAIEAYEERKTGQEFVPTRLRNDLNRDPTALIDEKRAYCKWKDTRVPLYPEPLSFKEIDYAPEESIRATYKQDGLQVIVKMASIELTPEKPEFPAGGWHLEGMMNEKIVATALFYLDSENVTDSHISFRAQTSSHLSADIETGQDAYNWLERVFGTCLGHAYAECWQPYGDVRTPQGRILAFPNTLVSLFKLQDPSRPGHRRFLALWLVDPHVRVISTANVPPQQKDWWVADQSGGPDQQRTPPPPSGLLTQEEARAHRLRLMEERGLGQKDLEHYWDQVQYAFCEH